MWLEGTTTCHLGRLFDELARPIPVASECKVSQFEPPQVAFATARLDFEGTIWPQRIRIPDPSLSHLLHIPSYLQHPLSDEPGAPIRLITTTYILF